MWVLVWRFQRKASFLSPSPPPTHHFFVSRLTAQTARCYRNPMRCHYFRCEMNFSWPRQIVHRATVLTHGGELRVESKASLRMPSREWISTRPFRLIEHTPFYFILFVQMSALCQNWVLCVPSTLRGTCTPPPSWHALCSGSVLSMKGNSSCTNLGNLPRHKLLAPAGFSIHIKGWTSEKVIPVSSESGISQELNSFNSS